MVTRELIILARFARELNCPAPKDLKDSILFQKKIYLLQASGIDLGYIFGWDLYGPYSKGLGINAAAYDEYKEEIDQVANDLKLTKWAREKIEQTKCLMAVPTGESIKEATWLELLSSIHYLARSLFKTTILQDQPEKTSKLNELLLGRKPHLKEYRHLIDESWKRLCSCPSH